jgi:uroporphyrinogen-III synthase
VRVLVTRPEPEASRTAAALKARGHAVVFSPVTRIVSTGVAPPAETVDAVLATSARAIEMLRDRDTARLRGVPLLVVGARARDAALARGFDVLSAAIDSGDLIARIATRFKAPSRFLYLAGRDRKPCLETRLRREGHAIDAIVVYEAREEPGLAPAAAEALRAGEIDACLIYSRRSAEILLRQAGEANALDALLRLTHACISADAAAPLVARGARTRVAATPDAAGLFAALETL